MLRTVGLTEGPEIGAFVGVHDGLSDGIDDARYDGTTDGCHEGSEEGTFDGKSEGATDSLPQASDGVYDGWLDGDGKDFSNATPGLEPTVSTIMFPVGTADGKSEGALDSLLQASDGAYDGLYVGDSDDDNDFSKVTPWLGPTVSTIMFPVGVLVIEDGNSEGSQLGFILVGIGEGIGISVVGALDGCELMAASAGCWVSLPKSSSMELCQRTPPLLMEGLAWRECHFLMLKLSWTVG
jgi:hypothetical protein